MSTPRPEIHYALHPMSVKYGAPFNETDELPTIIYGTMASEDWEYVAANRAATAIRLLMHVANAEQQPFDVARVLELLQGHLLPPHLTSLADQTEHCKIIK